MFNLSKYRVRKLKFTQGYKPLDFGGNGITGSVNQDGRIIAVNAYHPEHGYMTLTSAPPFSEEKRYDPGAVREYRRSLTELSGYGLEFLFPIEHREAYMIEEAVPYLRLVLKGGITVECITFITVEEPVGMMQIWYFSEPGSYARLTGKMWLQRAAYTQLTEGGVMSMPPTKSTVVRDTSDYLLQEIRNEALGASVHLRTAPLREAEDGSVEFYEDTINTRRLDDETLPYGAQTFVFQLGIDMQSYQSRARYMNLRTTSHTKNLYDAIDRWKRRWQLWKADDPDLELIRTRALSYGLKCCIPIDYEAVCIITDHMLLPLSWNRDAYYVAMALMRWNYEARDKVRGHLIWMFERAERFDRAWGRAYTVRGKVKDRGFQLDQQIFPLLELANYVIYTKDEEIFERLRPHIIPTLDMILARRHGDTWLFETEETPADDPIEYPYHFSSHVLLWRTLRQLGKIYRREDFDGLAKRIRKTIEKYFVTEYHGREVYAYATDGKGNHHLYHDANDVPLALMPQWGYCSSDDPLWRATVDFAWSRDNRGGVYDGKLGSVHTQAPWPLGDAQEMIIARLTQDEERYERVKQRIVKAAQWDGALPEAYSANDYSVVSRHWFAWTNAMLYYFDHMEIKIPPSFGGGF